MIDVLRLVTLKTLGFPCDRSMQSALKMLAEIPVVSPIRLLQGRVIQQATVVTYTGNRRVKFKEGGGGGGLEMPKAPIVIITFGMEKLVRPPDCETFLKKNVYSFQQSPRT